MFLFNGTTQFCLPNAKQNNYISCVAIMSPTVIFDKHKLEQKNHSILLISTMTIKCFSCNFLRIIKIKFSYP